MARFVRERSVYPSRTREEVDDGKTCSELGDPVGWWSEGIVDLGAVMVIQGQCFRYARGHNTTKRDNAPQAP